MEILRNFHYGNEVHKAMVKIKIKKYGLITLGAHTTGCNFPLPCQSVCFLHFASKGVLLFRTLGEILTPTEIENNLFSDINRCRISAAHFVYVKLHRIQVVVFMFVCST